MRPRSAGLTFVCMAVVSGLATAQTPPSSATEAVRVFLDCQFECDGQYLRTEINYVNWVVDRTVSDVHILVASEETGGGGRNIFEIGSSGHHRRAGDCALQAGSDVNQQRHQQSQPNPATGSNEPVEAKERHG